MLPTSKDREDLIEKIQTFKAEEPIEPLTDETSLFSETKENNLETMIKEFEKAFSIGKIEYDQSREFGNQVDTYRTKRKNQLYEIIDDQPTTSNTNLTIRKASDEEKEAFSIYNNNLVQWERLHRDEDDVEGHIRVDFQSKGIDAWEYETGKKKQATHLSVNPINPSEATLSILLVKPFSRDDTVNLETSLRGVMQYSNSIEDSFVNAQDEQGLLWPANVGIEKKDEEGERRITYGEGFERQVKTSYNSSDTFFSGRLETKNVPGLTVEESDDGMRLSTHSKESHFPLPLKQQVVENKLREYL